MMLPDLRLHQHSTRSKFTLLALIAAVRSWGLRFAVLAACSISLPAIAAQKEVPVWRITAPNGQTSILIGTLHVAHPELLQPAGALFDHAKQLVIEHSDVNPFTKELVHEAMRAQRGELAARAKWARTLTDQEINAIVRDLNCANTQPMTSDQIELVLRLPSPALLSALAYVPCAPRGLLSRDALLTSYAQARRLPIAVLESTEEIEARRRAIPDRLHEQALRYALRNSKTNLYAFVTDAMNRGDDQALLGLVQVTYGNTADAALFSRIMIDERNVLWSRRLVPILESGDAIIAVGVAHLPGRLGLVELLRGAGYRVEPALVPAVRSVPQ